eukprot:GHVR01077237.1.p1 GENE.GHVR01077237.1~~GHVR01077237.1.p1  ORF type:complete len:116 (+),score=14.66 GHVR01077237.1:649-996(+)
MGASSEGHVNVMEWLHENGVDLDDKDNDGDTALSIASNFGRLDAVKWLHDKGASLDTQNEIGRTPLMIACSLGNIKIMNLLHESALEIKNNVSSYVLVDHVAYSVRYIYLIIASC